MHIASGNDHYKTQIGAEGYVFQHNTYVFNFKKAEGKAFSGSGNAPEVSSLACEAAGSTT